MTKIKKLDERVVKISISLDPESLYYLDSLVGDRSSNIRVAIALHQSNQRSNYSKMLRELREKRNK
ncbi:MAG: hypothetical protein ACRC2R_11605 [Xenococcaceae cyanobacterium]